MRALICLLFNRQWDQRSIRECGMFIMLEARCRRCGVAWE